jgi:predicted aspartyl protease
LDVETVSFRLLHGVIALPVKVNGRGPFTFVLDTGAGRTVLLPALAAELGIPLTPLPFESASGAGGELAVSLGEVESLRIGEVEVADLPIAVLDLSGVEAKAGERLGGVIGSDVLARFETTINYRETKLVLRRLPLEKEISPPSYAPASAPPASPR